MGFPERWISWINSCLSSASFSILINGKPTSWFTSSRGVRQGDPISPLLFLLVTQNLSAILNHALRLNFLSGFDSNLPRNINHLMFADDLILISRASRQSARNLLFCLNLYASISGQVPNLLKSAIFLPSWFNKRVSKSISSILGIKLGNFSFTYLGAPISPNRLPARHFRPLIDNTISTINNWSHSQISQAGRIVLINSNIFALPVYLLSIFYLPNLILDSISKLARSFLWSRNGKDCGFHSVGWSTVTISKSEGGLGLRNLRHARLAILAKHVFSIANNSNKIWVSIFLHKYQNWSIWNSSFSTNTSSFFKAISKTASFIAPNITLSICHPDSVDVWRDPWILDLPLNCKPTFLNMNLIEHLSVYSLISEGTFNLQSCSSLFGGDLDRICLNEVTFDTLGQNEWVWRPVSSNATTVAAVYNFLNNEGLDLDRWPGWKHIWRIKAVPRVKLFIWKVAHGKLPTGAYLYNLNLGPETCCHFCGIHSETIEHLLWYCRCSRLCWNTIFSWLGLHHSFIYQLANGSWVSSNFNCRFNCDFARSILANVAWLIWTTRCNLIFQHIDPNFNSIPSRAWAFVQNYFTAKNPFRWRAPFPRRPTKLSLIVSTDAAWDHLSGMAGFGFIIHTNLHIVLLAGAAGDFCSSPLEAEFRAIYLALLHYSLSGWHPGHSPL